MTPVFDLAQAALAEKRERCPQMPDLGDLLVAWSGTAAPLRWQAEEIERLTSGSTAAPNGIRPSPNTVRRWRDQVRTPTPTKETACN